MNFDGQSRNVGEGGSSAPQPRNQHSDRKQLSTVEEESQCSDVTSFHHRGVHTSSRSRKSMRSPPQQVITFPPMFTCEEHRMPDMFPIGNSPARTALRHVTVSQAHGRALRSQADGPQESLRPAEVSAEDRNKSSGIRKLSTTEENFGIDSEEHTASNQKS